MERKPNMKSLSRKSGHTPGPFKVNGESTFQGRRFVEVVVDGKDVDGIFDREHLCAPIAWCFGLDKEANAVLIAAAPEMKDELITLVNCIYELLEKGKITQSEYEELVEPTKIVIAKAEGR